MQWQGGVEADLWKDLEAAFVAKNPGVTIRELVMTGQGDMRGPMRTALLGGVRTALGAAASRLLPAFVRKPAFPTAGGAV